MKFEFALDVKGVPTANVHVALECSAEELVTLISDPVYQGLGQKFINEVSFKPLDHEPAQQKTFKPQHQPSDVTVEELDKKLQSVLTQVKRELDSDRKGRETALHIIEKLMDKASKLAERNSKF